MWRLSSAHPLGAPIQKCVSWYPSELLEDTCVESAPVNLTALKWVQPLQRLRAHLCHCPTSFAEIVSVTPCSWLPSLCAGGQLCRPQLGSGVTINIVVEKKKKEIFLFVMTRGGVPTPQRGCAQFHENQLISTDSPLSSSGRWRNLVQICK